MKFDNACIPLGGAWSSPFVRWPGSLAEVNALDLAVDVTRRAPERALQDAGLTWGVFTGCAAGDTGAAIALRVED